MKKRFGDERVSCPIFRKSALDGVRAGYDRFFNNLFRDACRYEQR